MAALAVNNVPVLFAVLMAPRVGVWVADVELATDTAPAGRIEVVAESGGSWSGTVVAGGVSGGAWRGRIVGGAGGLRRELPATSYRNATLADVLGDVLREAGETMDAVTDLSGWSVARYVRVQRPACRTVADVARAAGVSWRVTRAGAVRVAAETWEALPLSDVSVIGEDPANRRYTLAGDVLALEPGALVALPLESGTVAVQVDSVELRVADSQVTAAVWAHG